MALTKLTTDLDNAQGLDDQIQGQASTVKEIFDKAGNDIKTFVNDTLIEEIEAQFATKAELITVELGQITDETITPAKLNDDALLQDGNYFVSTNTGNAYVITSGRSLASLTAGMTFKVKINADSSGNTTLNVDSIGAVNILKANGSNVTNLKEDGIYTLVYDGTSFILQGEGGEGTAVIADVLASKTFTNDTGDVLTGTMTDRTGDTVALSSSVSGTTLKLLASDGYRDGVNDNVTLTDADFVAGNILTGVDLFGVTGSAIEKKYATGSVATGATGSFTRWDASFVDTFPRKLIVTGLTFEPKHIIIFAVVGATVIGTVYDSLNPPKTNGPIALLQSSTDNWVYKVNVSDASVTSTGFVLPVEAAGTFRWVAYA